MRGVEVVSPALPPLQGEEGIAEMVRVCKALTAFGCEITNDCGMHVHVGVADQGLAFFKRIVRLYQTYEPVLDAMMPQSRAGPRNIAPAMTAVSPALVAQAPGDQTAGWRNSGPGPRILDRAITRLTWWLSARHRTVEFRHPFRGGRCGKIRNVGSPLHGDGGRPPRAPRLFLIPQARIGPAQCRADRNEGAYGG